jgi:hypothetical protein
MMRGAPRQDIPCVPNKPDPSWRWCREDRTTGITTRSNFGVASNIVETIYGDDDDAIRSHMLDAYLGQTIETPEAFFYYQPLQGRPRHGIKKISEAENARHLQ